jgi:uncharacterized protein YegP (UPF0339 family)
MKMRPPRNRVEIYQDIELEWRWRAILNSYIVADSGEAYTRQASARRAFERVRALIRTLPLLDLKS